MPLHWDMHPEQQLIVVTAEGEVTLAELWPFLTEIRPPEKMAWRKLADLRDLRVALTAEEVNAVGIRIRSINFLGEVGPLAVIMPKVNPEGVMRLLGFLAAADRPMLIAETFEEAQRWIESVHSMHPPPT